MPIYEYRCRKCSHQFERIRPMDDDGADLECPECGRRAPERVLSVFAASTGSPDGGPAGGCGPSGFG
jgi:putative FmdB family regulatory protein